jgi:hypothetical protein
MEPPSDTKKLPLKMIGGIIIAILVCLGIGIAAFGTILPSPQKATPLVPDVTPAAPTLSAITPSGGAFRTIVPVTIEGTNFSYGPSPAIWLAKEGQPAIAADYVNVISPTQIKCIFPLTGSSVSAGQWDVYLKNPNEQAGTKIGVFTVTDYISPSVMWNWSSDGWGDWKHQASCEATTAPGVCTEYGPALENGAGVHGSKVTSNGIPTESRVGKTFTAATGSGWSAFTLKGQLSRSTEPTLRWIAVDVNGVRVYYADASQTPPGNGQPFTITQSFAPATRVNIVISSGQELTWDDMSPYTLQFDSLTLS